MSKETMSDTERYVDAAAAAIGLAIPAEYRAGVVTSFAQNAAMAELLMSFDIADDTDPAPVFRP